MPYEPIHPATKQAIARAFTDAFLSADPDIPWTDPRRARIRTPQPGDWVIEQSTLYRLLMWLDHPERKPPEKEAGGVDRLWDGQVTRYLRTSREWIPWYSDAFDPEWGTYRAGAPLDGFMETYLICENPDGTVFRWTNAELLAIPPGVPIGPGRACHDCGVEPGLPHEDHCDVAVCLATGGQRLMCELAADGKVTEWLSGTDPHGHALAGMVALADTGPHDCGADVWTGLWPGEIEAAMRGWFCYFAPPWTPCGPDHPGATPDLNRWHADTRWDAEKRRRVSC